MATENKTLTTSWQLLIAGPAVVTLEIGAVALLHSAPSMPAADAAVQRLRSGTDRESRTFNGSNNIYAKKDIEQPVVVAYGE